VTIRWVLPAVVHALHDEQLAQHGGLAGLRDENLLLSALARPQNLAMYGHPCPDLAALAAAYIMGILRNHPFADGNKRTALLVGAGVFLPLNGYRVQTSEVELVQVTLRAAAGEMSEEELAAWLRGVLAKMAV